MTKYLIWSNHQNAWWGPNGGHYVQDIWDAGRFDLDDAEQRMQIRTWEPGRLPPEVAVKAPESHMPLDTWEQIECAPEITRRMVDDITRVAARERFREVAA
jgi:hypothetical protein